jgi:teichuronic acid biosynthesis glycosyltransferase TuaC
VRIAHWTDLYPLTKESHNGHAIRKLVEALRLMGGATHDVHQFFPLGNSILKYVSPRYKAMADALRSGPYEDGLYYHRMLQLPKNLFSTQINPFWQKHFLPKLAGQIGCDLIHVHTCYNLAYGAVLAGKRFGIPVVATIRREQEMTGLPARRVRFLMEAMKLADAVISPSAHLAEKCRRATGADVHIIPSGTETIFDENPPADLPRKRQVLFAGTLDKNKGIEVLLKASFELFASGFCFELCIIGDGPLRKKWQAISQRYPNIRFLGSVKPEVVRDQMRHSKVFCMPSYTETLGLVFLETMKQGVAVIGRKGTGIDGMGVAGKDYEVIENDAQLPTVLRTLLSDEARRLKLAAAGQRLAKDWTWENSVLKHMAIYKQLIHKKKYPI